MIKATFTMQDNTGQFKAAMDAALDAACEEIGQECEDYIKMVTPVGTPESTGIDGYHGGELRNSITHVTTSEGTEHKAIVGTNKYYAAYVELGTGKYAANGNGRKTPWAWTDKNGEVHFTHGMKPRHFVKNGITNAQPTFQGIIEKHLKGQ